VRSLEILQPCDFTTRDGMPTAVPGVLRCRGCGNTVTDLAMLTEAEGLAFLAFLERRAPRECVRFRVTEDRRVVFADGVGSLLARIAEGARPMISVAALALSACAATPAPRDAADILEEGLPLITPSAAPGAPTAAAEAPEDSPAVYSAPSAGAGARGSARRSTEEELTGFVFNDEPIVPPPSVQRPPPR
jgi:hypothetical protein